jgi:hypothetical protein
LTYEFVTITMLAVSRSEQNHGEDRNRRWYEEARLMNISRTWSCLLLLGAVLNFSGCDQIRKICGKGGGRAPTITNMPVSITGSDCGVTDPINEHPGTPVIWTFSSNSHLITWNPKYDKNTHQDITPPQVTYTSSGARWDNPNTTPTHCGDNGGGCYFKYNILRGDKSLCNDPGIQIIP